MVSLEQDVFLQLSRLDLVILDQDVLSDRLDSILLPGGWQMRQIHSSKRSLTKLELDVEVRKLDVDCILSFTAK